MKNQTIIKQNANVQNGSAVVYALIVLFMILVSALGVASVAVMEQRSSIVTGQSTQGFQVADSGAEIVLGAMRKMGVTEPESALTRNISDFANASSGISGASCSGNILSWSGVFQGQDVNYSAIFHDKADETVKLDCNQPVTQIVDVQVAGEFKGTVRSVSVPISGCSFYAANQGLVATSDGTAALWHLDEIGSDGSRVNDFADISGYGGGIDSNQNIGQIEGSGIKETTENAICRKGKEFGGGSDDRIDIDLTGLGSLNQKGTFEAWLQANGDQDNGCLGIFQTQAYDFDWADVATVDDRKGQFLLATGKCDPLSPGETGVHFVIYDDAGVASALDADDQIADDDSWTYLAVTWDKDASGTEKIFLYLNGEEKGKTAGPASWSGASLNDAGVLGSANNKQAWKGIIDETRISNYAKTSEEIQAVWNSFETE
ncbi:hypothetical protein EPO05_05240 [Patescibacteria group bacterium]|nr:MAG: hypothetical protein EPO05_05240 [Patescibacteria group bacterium]